MNDTVETPASCCASLIVVGRPQNQNEFFLAPPRTTRRAVLALSGALLGLSRGFADVTVAQVEPHKKEFLDPATEFQVTRWTEEGAEARLPGDPDRVISRNDALLLYSSNRSGQWMPYVMRLPSGESTLLAEAQQLQPASLAFLRGDGELIFVDGPSVVRTQLRRPRPRTLYRADDGWMPTGDIRIAPDDRTVALLQTRSDAARVVFVELSNGRSRTVIEAEKGALTPLDLHPRYGLFLLDSRGLPAFQGGTPPSPLPAFPEGRILQARFNAEGDRLTYLLRSPGPPERTLLMELALPGGRHELVASTSKFATFSPNPNSSVFVGASDSVAQPLLLLLLRVTRREFALMEHSATQPSVVQPLFSNNSQLIFFQSDRLGKNCIFSVSVKGLVERT
jgi:hypothetical protein